MKRFLLFTLLVLIINMTYFSSCKNERNIEISISEEISGEILFSSNRTDFENTIFKDYISEFESRFTNVHIKVETIKDYIDTMKIKMSSNNLPDVWTVHGGTYTKTSIQKYNVNLSREFPYLIEDYNGTEIYKGADGNIYAFTTGMSYDLVIYNKNIFSEVGIEVPKKLSDFIEISKKVKRQGYKPLGISAYDDWILYNFFYTRPKEISGNTNILNELISRDQPFNDENPVYKSYKILDLLVKEEIISEDVLGYKWESMKKDYQDGKIAMVIIGSWFIPQACAGYLKLDDIGVFPFPVDEDDKLSSVVRGPDVGFAISKNSENKELAKKFFLFMADEKCIDFAEQCGLASPRKSREIDLEWLKELDSYNVEILETVEENSKLKEIINKVDFNQGEEIAKDVIRGKSIDKIFENLNDRWEKAK